MNKRIGVDINLYEPNGDPVTDARINESLNRIRHHVGSPRLTASIFPPRNSKFHFVTEDGIEMNYVLNGVELIRCDSPWISK